MSNVIIMKLIKDNKYEICKRRYILKNMKINEDVISRKEEL